MSQRFGDLLAREKVLTPEQLEQAIKVQTESKISLGSALVTLGFLSEEDVVNFLSRHYRISAINLSYFEIDPSVVKLIPYETAKRYLILPLSRKEESVTVAMANPIDVFAMDVVKSITGLGIEPVVASESSILARIEKAYGGTQEPDSEGVATQARPAASHIGIDKKADAKLEEQVTRYAYGGSLTLQEEQILKAHLAECPSCREFVIFVRKSRAVAQVDGAPELGRIDCPGTEQLRKAVDGTLDEFSKTRVDEIRQHILNCRECRGEYLLISSLVKEQLPDDLFEPK
jgi:Type II secretion system (T2SS), protein E, N-terminal domain/Putative zinc-finger